MTISPGDPGPVDPDDGTRAIPPYEGRRTSADVSGEEEMRKEGANVAGATGPVESDEMKAPDPQDTERGRHASPAVEEPASEAGDEEPADEGTGPAHYSGTTRAEDA